MNWLIVITLMAGGAVGCVANSRAPVPASPTDLVYLNTTATDDPDFNHVSPLRGGHSLEDIHSHLFGLEGRILRIREDGPILQSITVQVIRPLRSPLGVQPYQEYGDEMVVHFDTRASNFDSLGLGNDTIVAFYYGSIDNSTDWGSNLAWLFFWKDGECYGISNKPEAQ